MSRHILFLFGILTAGFLLFGCAGNTPVAQVSNNITFTTGVGTGAQNVVALPAALEGAAYAATITPSGGAQPYRCESIPPGSMIIGTIQLNAACVIAGNAPVLSPGTTHGIYPVRFNIIDNNGVVAGPFDLALEVVKSQGQDQGQQQGQQVNPDIPTLILPQHLPNATVFRAYNQTFLVQGGTPPYQAMACKWNGGYGNIMGLEADIQDGVLNIRGIPRNEDVGEYDISCCIFVKAGSSELACWNTTLSVEKVEETWAGTFQTKRSACRSIYTQARQGELSGTWTATITIPARLPDLLADSTLYDLDSVRYHSTTKVSWDGSESVAQQCADIVEGGRSVPTYYTAFGGSASVQPRFDVDYSRSANLSFYSEDINLPMLPGGFCSDGWIKPTGKCSYLDDAQSGIELVPTSTGENRIEGNILGYFASDAVSGTFTLTKVK
ncbi:Uncharacterised protein [uncultured archaeon]|nr:Uncharacterised protein [uncultured archaeon]